MSQTKARLKFEWEKMIADADDRPTVKEFCDRVGISTSNLYHNYPDWAEKVAIRRDERLIKSRKASHVTKKNQYKEKNAAAEIIVERLRKHVAALQLEVTQLKKERDKLLREANDLTEEREKSERLRAVVQQYGRTVKKFSDSRTANNIIIEMEKFKSRHLSEPIG